MAELTNLVEGTRPVSGDRKVGARIEGRETFVIDEDKLAISKEGYLVVSDISCEVGADDCRDKCDDGVSMVKGGEDIKIVVVVGLLHVNGVIDRLATQ